MGSPGGRGPRAGGGQDPPALSAAPGPGGAMPRRGLPATTWTWPTGSRLRSTRGPGLDAAGQVLHTEPDRPPEPRRGGFGADAPATPPPAGAPPQVPSEAPHSPQEPRRDPQPGPPPGPPQRSLPRRAKPGSSKPSQQPSPAFADCQLPHGPVVASTPSRADRGLPALFPHQRRCLTGRNRPSQRGSRGLTGQQAAALQRGCTRG
jgi:hypothetical protein